MSEVKSLTISENQMLVKKSVLDLTDCHYPELDVKSIHPK